MKKYLITLLVVCLMFTGCGVSKESPNKGKQKESTKTESTEKLKEDLTNKSYDDSSNKSVGENSTDTNDDSKRTHPISSAGNEIEIDIDLPTDEQTNTETHTKTYSMVSSTNVMSEDAGHDGAIPPTLELRDNLTFTLNYNSTQNIVGSYEKADGNIICRSDTGKYVFTDNGDGTLNYNGKDSDALEKKNDNEYEITDGALFFSN